MGKSIQKLNSVTRVGLDLAKKVFQVHAVDGNGEMVVARKLARGRLVDFFSQLPRCVVAMEACSSAHHWGRQLLALGFEVRLIPPAHVKPYVRRNKNDAVDAAAICEAAGRPGQRFVPVRSIENQAELMRHRARELLAGQRTAALNALRGHLAEIGVIAPQGVQHAYDLKRLAVDGFDEYGEVVVPDSVRVALRPLVSQIDALDEAIGAIDMSERTDGAFSRSVLPTTPNATSMPRSFANAAACSLRCDRTSLTARSFAAPANSTATPARSSPNAARTFPHARSRALFMKPLATRHARSPRPKPTPSHAASGRGSRCSSLT